MIKRYLPDWASIRVRILVGFAAGALFTLLAALLSVSSFDEVVKHVNTITREQAPALVQSIKLSARFSDLIAQIPYLIRVQNAQELDEELDIIEAKKAALSDELDKTQSLILTQEDKTNKRITLLKKISASNVLLLGNVNAMESSIANEIVIRDESSQIINRFLSIQEGFLNALQTIITSSQINKKDIATYNLIQILLELKSDSVLLANEVKLVPTLKEIESINISQEQSLSLLKRMNYRSKSLANPIARDKFIATLSQMQKAIESSSEGIYATQVRVLGAQDVTNNFLRANKKLSYELETLTNQFTSLQQQYNDQGLLAAEKSVKWVKINLALLVIFNLLVGGILAWLFIGPWIGRRLVTITRHLELIIQGNLDASIKVAFEDELGQIEKGLQLFQETAKAHRAAEAELVQLAEFDALTGLPNRRFLHDRIEHAIGLAQRQDQVFAVMFIDLDRFKLVNDSQGHHVGDQLLTHVAKRLSAIIRKTDIVGRLGGDEFAVLAMLTKDDDINVLADKVLKQMNQPVFMNGQEYFVGASIGISLYPADGLDSATLLRKSDTAMYMAKEQGGGHLRFFSEEMNENTTLRFEMHNQLREALNNKEFELWYQPQVKLELHEVVGVEALIRWKRPDGFVPPNRFIAMAEEMGIIEELSEWVLDQACHDCQLWRRAGFDIPVSINVSPKQLVATDRFENALQKTLHRYGLTPDYIVLEVTESAVMYDLEHSSALLKKLRKLGYRIALDDFGTGYSSLNHLRSLPIDELKIDKTFIDNIAYSPVDIALTRVIVELGNQLNLSIVFEGVETQEQRKILSLTGHHTFQGYHFSKPLPLSDLIRWFGTQISNLTITD